MRPARSIPRSWGLLLLTALTGCQWAAGFDDRRLVEEPQPGGGQGGASGAAGNAGAPGGNGGTAGAGGTAGDGGSAAGGGAGEGGTGGTSGAAGVSGASGQAGGGGAAGQGGAAGKRPPLRPEGEATAQGGKVLHLASLRLHLGAYNPADCKEDNTCTPDPAAWKNLGFDLDGRCSGGCLLSSGDPPLADGNDCIDNSLGSFIATSDGNQAFIEGPTNRRLLEGGVALGLRISDLGDGPDDPYAPGEAFLLAATEAPAWDGTDERAFEERSLLSGQLGLPILRFPRGYVRDHVWVSGDFGERAPGEVQLPISASESKKAQDQLLRLPFETLTLVLPMDSEHTGTGLSIVSFLSSMKALGEGLLPLFVGVTGECNALGSSLLLNELSTKAPDLARDAPGFNAEGTSCDAVSSAVGIVWKPILPPTKIASTLPAPNCDACVPGTRRCQDGVPSLCEAPPFGTPTFKPLDPCDGAHPVCVEGTCVAIQDLTCGNDHSCVLLSSEGPLDGRVYCWGAGEAHQTGQSAPVSVHRPVPVPLPGKVTQLSSKFQNTCATLDDGTVHCWGSALKRQLGPAVSINTVGSAPVLVPLPKGAARAEAGFSQSCAILQDGQLACWGSNQFGQLGNGTEVGSSPTPSLVQDTSGAPLSQVDALTIGEFHTCAAQSSGDLRCWGLRGEGVWGHTQGALVTSNKATLVASGAPILGLIAGQASTFVFREDRKLLAMGFNEEGQLGLTADLPKEAPFTYALFPSFTEVPGLGPVREISHGSGEFACAIGTDDALSCWGENADGQLGAPLSLPQPPPVTPQLPQARKVCAGGRNTCVIDLDGQLQCWGYNNSGQLGRGVFQSGIGDHIPAPVQWWSP